MSHWQYYKIVVHHSHVTKEPWNDSQLPNIQAMQVFQISELYDSHDIVWEYYA